MGCILSVIGEDLDVDAFVKESKISGFNVSYKGQAINKVNPRKLTYSAASINTSNADFYDINGQIQETIEFLTKYKTNLVHIRTTPNIQYATINFGVDSIIDKNHLSQSFYFPIELVSLCAELKIGIELSTYKLDLQSILEMRTNS